MRRGIILVLALSCALAGILFRPLKPTIVDVPTIADVVPTPNPVVMEPKLPEDEPLLTTTTTDIVNERKMSVDSRHNVGNKIAAPTVEEIYNHLSGGLTPELMKGISVSCHSLNTREFLNKDALSNGKATEKNLRRPSLSAHLMDRDDRFFGGSLCRLPQYSSQVSTLARF